MAVTVTIRTHLPSPTDLTFQEYIASDKTISLKFNTPSTIIGLNTSNYKIHYKPVGSQSSYTELLLSELNSSGKFVNGFYLITGLTNGTEYEFYYSAQLDNSENVQEGQPAILTTNSILIFLTPLKEADHVQYLDVVSHNAGLVIDLYWNSPELNGSTFVSYELYKRQSGTISWTTLPMTTTSTNYTFTADNSYYDKIYEFHVKVITRDINTEAILKSSDSNVVKHHFFEAPKKPTINSHSFISTKENGVTSYSIRFKILNYYISNSLFDQLLHVRLNGSAIPSFYHSPTPVAGTNYHEFILSDIEYNMSHLMDIRVIGKNPNDRSLPVNSDYSAEYNFNYFGIPHLINSSVVVESKDSSLLIKINENNDSLDLKNTIFQRYEVTLQKLSSGIFLPIYTINIAKTSVNDLYIYGLINGETYRVSLVANSLSPIPNNYNTYSSNSVQIYAYPLSFIQNEDVPLITLKSRFNNRLTFNVNTKGLPLLGWYLFIQHRRAPGQNLDGSDITSLDAPQYPRYNQFLYRSPPNSISSVNENNIVEIVVDVLKDLNGGFYGNLNLENIVYSFVAYNINGRSEYNNPSVIYNPVTKTGNYIMYTNAGNLSNGHLTN